MPSPCKTVSNLLLKHDHEEKTANHGDSENQWKSSLTDINKHETPKDITNVAPTFIDLEYVSASISGLSGQYLNILLNVLILGPRQNPDHRI